MSTSTEIHQQTPSSDDHTITIKTTYEYEETDHRIRLAAIRDDWENVGGLFEERPELMIKPVNKHLETPLMIAVRMNSHEFVKQLLNNVETHDRDKWCGEDIIGNNALHYAVRAGNIIDAKLMLQCLPETMTTIRNIHGDMPATLAVKLGRKDMIDEVFNGYADAIKMAYEYAETDLRIYKAALRNEWDDVHELFEERPELKFKPVNERLETPLMIAVGTNRSHEFVKQLLNNVDHEDLRHDDEWCGMNIHGNNALHYAAKVGNIIDAQLMLQCLSFAMRWNKNIDGDTPYLLAARLGRMEMIDELFTEATLDENLVVPAIQAGEIDFALEIINNFAGRKIKIPNAVENALEALAAKPDLFSSGNKLGLSGGLIYPWMLTLKSKIHISLRRICRLTVHIIRTVLLLLFMYVKTWPLQIQEIKRKNLPSHNLVLQLCDMIEKNPKDAKKYFEPAIATAVKYGNVELIEECIFAYPGLIWYEFDGYNLFHLAIKHRQVQVYNLLYQMSGHKAFVASELYGVEKENALHIAAKLAPPHRLKTITGAALKMQHELQWYKEVLSFVEPEHVKALNKDGKNPWMVFTDAHQDLLKEGQQWMKDSSTSCTVVAALIVTISFAAGITVPGEYKDDGKPLFLNERAFMLFIVSDTIALLSSCASLLIFLRILISGNEDVDFLHILPKRLIIGLHSLFLSIAATMIAFGATLALLLHHKVTWIAAPVILITSIPVGLYVMLQFPLIIEMVKSTYGPSIFRKQSSRVIY